MYDLSKYKAQNKESKAINERIQAIRQRILKAEQFKMNLIEGYVLDYYYIMTANPKDLLKKYHLTNEYDDKYIFKKPCI